MKKGAWTKAGYDPEIVHDEPWDEAEAAPTTIVRDLPGYYAARRRREKVRWAEGAPHPTLGGVVRREGAWVDKNTHEPIRENPAYEDYRFWKHDGARRVEYFMLSSPDDTTTYIVTTDNIAYAKQKAREKFGWDEVRAEAIVRTREGKWRRRKPSQMSEATREMLAVEKLRQRPPPASTYNQPDYKWYVVDALTERIDSGWEHKADAHERRTEINEDEGGSAKLYSKTHLKRAAIDPDHDGFWVTGMPRSNPAKGKSGWQGKRTSWARKERKAAKKDVRRQGKKEIQRQRDNPEDHLLWAAGIYRRASEALGPDLGGMGSLTDLFADQSVDAGIDLSVAEAQELSLRVPRFMEGFSYMHSLLDGGLSRNEANTVMQRHAGKHNIGLESDWMEGALTASDEAWEYEPVKRNPDVLKVIVTEGGHVFDSWEYEGVSPVARELLVTAKRDFEVGDTGMVYVLKKKGAKGRSPGRLKWDKRNYKLQAEDGTNIAYKMLQEFIPQG
jgi:hypothetical protein